MLAPFHSFPRIMEAASSLAPQKPSEAFASTNTLPCVSRRRCFRSPLNFARKICRIMPIFVADHFSIWSIVAFFSRICPAAFIWAQVRSLMVEGSAPKVRNFAYTYACSEDLKLSFQIFTVVWWKLERNEYSRVFDKKAMMFI